MPFRFGNPYRPPCGGWPASPTFGLVGPWNNTIPAEKSIQVFQNVTEVKDCYDITQTIYYASPGDGQAQLGPQGADTNTFPECQWSEGCNCPGKSDPFGCYGPWDPAKFIACTGYADYTGHTGYTGSLITKGNNCYIGTTDTEDQSTCRKMGFKNVQARKSWHGMFGFTTHDPGGMWDWTEPTTSWPMISQGNQTNQYPYEVRNPTSYGCGCGPYECERGSPDGTKFLAMSGTGYFKNVSTDDPPVVTEQSITFNSSVDSGTGIGHSNYVEKTEGNERAAELLLSWCGANGNTCYQMYASNLNNAQATWQETQTAADGTAYSATCYTYWAGGDDGGSVEPLVVMSVTLNSSFHVDYYGATVPVDSDPPVKSEWVLMFSGDLIVSETELHWKGTGQAACQRNGSPISTWEETVDLYLTTPYYASDVLDSVKALLAHWDMKDDMVYPWRRDSNLTLAPLLSYDEVRFGVNPISFFGAAYGNPDWVDGNASVYTGAPLGDPLPAGYAPYFDHRHPTWRCCIGDNGQDDWFIGSYGAWSGQGGIPATATQWTDNYAASVLWPGAWLYYGPVGGSMQLWGQKWAETRIPRPSVNFARPCGEDRYTMNADTVQCAALIPDTSPQQVILASAYTAASTITTGDKVMVVLNNVATDGVWTVTNRSPILTQPVLELTTAVVLGVKPSNVLDGNIGTGFVGKLRWPDAPPICGRSRIVSATNTNPVIITFGTDDEEAKYLRNGDKIFISGATSNTAINNTTAPGWTLNNKSGTSFELTGCAGNGIYNGTGYASRTDGIDYWLDDDNSKGDWIYASWGFNFRDIGERNRDVGQYVQYLQYADFQGTDSDGPYTLDCFWSGRDTPGDGFSPGEVPDLIRAAQANWGMPPQVNSLSIAGTQAPTELKVDCVPWNMCRPAVLCVSPNSPAKDHAANWYTRDFGGFSLDERYSSLWQGAFMQHMMDPLWQPPPAPCQGLSVPKWRIKSFTLAAGGGGYSASPATFALQTTDSYGTPAQFTATGGVENASVEGVAVSGGVVGYGYTTGTIIPLLNPGQPLSKGAYAKISGVDEFGGITELDLTNMPRGTGYYVGEDVSPDLIAPLRLTITTVIPTVSGQPWGRVATAIPMLPEFGGFGYQVGDIIDNAADVTGRDNGFGVYIYGTGATFRVTAVNTDYYNAVVSVAVVDGGMDYWASDVLVVPGGSGASLQVTDIGTPVTSLTITDRGRFDSVPTNPMSLYKIPGDSVNIGFGAKINAVFEPVVGDDVVADPCQWNEDDGSCLPDQNADDDFGTPCIKYYPARPYVEALAYYPTGYSGNYETRSGVKIGFVPLAQMTGTPPLMTSDGPIEPAEYETYATGPTNNARTGNVLPPPGPPGVVCNGGTAMPLAYQTPWGLYNDENVCVCRNWRADFVPFYQKNGVLCTYLPPTP